MNLSSPPTDPTGALVELSNDVVDEKVRSRSIVFEIKMDGEVDLGLLRAILSLPWAEAEVHRIQGNTFFAIFPTYAQKAKCLGAQPWIIRSFLLTMASLRTHQPFFTLLVNSTQTWVQIHGLNPDHISNLTIWQLAALFQSYHGHVQVPRVCDDQFGQVRVRVGIDSSKPLHPGCLLTFNDDPPYLLLFKYEKIRNICFHCGRIGHSNCGIRVGGDFATPFGKWMLGQTPIVGYASSVGGPAKSTDNKYVVDGLCPQRMQTTAHFSDFIVEPDLQTRLYFTNTDRLEMQNLFRNHVYYDPIQGWTVDAGFPQLDDNFIQSVFSYTNSTTESTLIQKWEETNNPHMFTHNSRLEKFCRWFQLQQAPKHEEDAAYLHFPAAMFKEKVPAKHQKQMESQVPQFMFKGFPTVTVIDNDTERVSVPSADASSSSSSPTSST